MADLHELSAAYAVDALDDTERAAFEDHLAACSACAAELAAMETAVVGLADSAATEPPARMRAAVLDAIASTEQADVARPDRSDNVVDLQERRVARYRRLAVGFGAAAVLATVVAAASLLSSGGGPSADDIVSAADATTVGLSGDIGSASFVYSLDEGGGLFVSSELPPVASDETYQLWLIDDDGPSSAGTFVPRDGSVALVVEGLAPGQTLGMTVEPAGGSPAPTSEVLLVAEVN